MTEASVHAQTDDSPVFVVGIGASAGGLDAIEALFDHMPKNSGLAFVVIQHLSPDFKSLMGQLLARKTEIPVQIIEDNEQVLANRIYLMPEGKEVMLSEGRLLLADRARDDHSTFPIDHFFRSVAQDCGTRSVGVVLSGAGSDGARGVLDIHAEGGLVVVQDQETAKFTDMPRNAIESGIVDLVLSPKEIAAALGRYACNSGKDASGNLQSERAIEEPIALILARLRDQYSLDFKNFKANTISRRIERRLMLSSSVSIEEYAAEVLSDDNELDYLYQDLLVGATNFFRDEEAFEALAREVLPKSIANLAPGQEFRAWVAGCASGEEAYSVAILLSEYVHSRNDPRPIRIFASDVHQPSLSVGSRGVYQKQALTNLPDSLISKYFIERNDGFHITPELRKLVVFTPHNILQNAPFTNLDLITCRNVLIHMNAKAQRKVMSMFHFGLKRGGVMVLGMRETPSNMLDEFAPIHEQFRIYRKQRDDSPIGKEQHSSSTVITSRDLAIQGTQKRSRPTQHELLPVYDNLLAQCMPPSMLVSSNNELLHSFSGASCFLRPKDGRPSNNLLDMILPGLKSSVAVTLRRAKNGGESAAATAWLSKSEAIFSADMEHHDADCGEDGTPHEGEEVQVKVTTTALQSGDEIHYLIRFGEFSPGFPDVDPLAAHVQDDADFLSLERELEATNQRLQTATQQFQSMNEELQMANEELTASSEELQSTNEELHSVNEELYTVNSEHQRKIDELTELTDDMDNLLTSTNIRTVFLDRDLCLRRFTPDVANIFKFLPQDIGRRFDSFSHNLQTGELLPQLCQVLDSGRPSECEVSDHANKWYLMRLLPYVAREKVAGVVITLIDISSQKEAQSRLHELSEIVQQSDDAIYRVDIDGTIRTWNRGAMRLYGYAAEEVINKSVNLLAPDDIKNEPLHYLDRIRSGVAIDHVETMRQRKNGTILNVELTVSPLWDDSKQCLGASVVARDVTQQKQAELEIRNAVRQRDRFLAMLSHELRNPLAAIVNASSLLKENVDSETASEARDVAETQLKHITRLLDDLLDVARIANDKLTLQSEVVDLKKSMLDATECVQHQVDEKRQHLIIEMPDESIFVLGDVGRLQQAQVNLLVNASKYSPPETTITFSVTRDDKEAVISVHDQGQVISNSLARHIFEPFVQADETLDRSQGGMGLGLPLVSMIARAHGGSVSLNANPRGLGNEFILRIPTTNASEIDDQSHQTEVNLEGKRLLLVEDNDGVRTMLARSLELKGFEVATAADGIIALELFDDFAPEIAVIDIGLPDVSGYEVAERIREKNTKQTILVAVTGYGRHEDVAKAEASGFNTHILKPIDPNLLVERLAELHSQPIA